MTKIKVAAVQKNALMRNMGHNLDVHRHFTGRAVKAGSDLLMFPELSTTSHYGDPEATQFAEPTGNGPVFDAVSSLANKHSIVIGYGFCEIARSTYYSSFALVGARGLVGIQCKTHSSMDEYLYFRTGRSLQVSDLGFCRAGVLVCYDADFFEAWRVLALMGAEVVLLPHSARIGCGKRIPKTKQLESLRKVYRRLPGKRGHYAADNCVFAVYANQVEYNGHSTHGG
jgi:predicted amidohydrolase